MSADLPPHLPDAALAAVVVILGAARRFDLPSSVREYTTALRHAIGLTGYALTLVLLYCVLYSLNRRLHVPGAAWVAAALALLCWHLPFMSGIDLRLRDAFHRLTGAPFEAWQLAAMLTPEHFHPSRALQQEVRAILLLRGYDVDDDWLPAAAPLRAQWLHAAMCYFLVRDWERPGSGYTRFITGRARQDFDSLRQRFDQLSGQVVRVLATVERLADMWSEAEKSGAVQSPGVADGATDAAMRTHRRAEDTRAIVTELISDLREDVEHFFDSLSVFIARGVLASSLTERQRRSRLSRMGFAIERTDTSLTVVLFWTAVFYLLAFLVLGLLSGRNPLRQPEGPIWLFIVAATQTMAVAAAIVPKRLFGFANEDLYGNTPWGFVFAAGAAAVALAVLLRALLMPGFFGTLQSPRTLWLLSPFTTAAATAWLVQDSRWMRFDSAVTRRLLDALVMTAAVAVAATSIRLLRLVLFSQPWLLERLLFDIGLALSVGVVIGYNVPSRFRIRAAGYRPRAASADDGRGLWKLLRPRAAFGPGR